MKNIINYSKKYLSELVYGGMDGCVTTFAVVSGSVGAKLDITIILILGISNLIADGFSMSVGSYLSHKSEDNKNNKSSIISGISTFLSFFIMGSIPLLPYVFGYFIDIPPSYKFLFSCILTGITFIIIGISRCLLKEGKLIKTTLETLILGASAASIAYYIGAFIDNLIK